MILVKNRVSPLVFEALCRIKNAQKSPIFYFDVMKLERFTHFPRTSADFQELPGIGVYFCQSKTISKTISRTRGSPVISSLRYPVCAACAVSGRKPVASASSCLVGKCRGMKSL